MSQTRAMNDVQLKRSWKMPVVYVLAALLQILFVVKVSGDVTIRLNDKSQSINIDDIVTPGRPILLALTVFTLLVTAWSIYSVWARRQNPRWLDVTMMIVAGIATVFGFLIYAGSGSAGVVTLTSTLYSTVAISTPLIFGSLSGVVSERVGVVNIAIEGDLLLGAFAGVMAASFFQTSWAGLIAAPIAGAFLGCLLALFSVKYGVDQIIVGVVLNVLAAGLTTFFYGTWMTKKPELFNTNRFSLPDIKIPLLGEIPILGPVLFNHNILVYLMYATVIFLAVYLYRSRWSASTSIAREPSMRSSHLVLLGWVAHSSPSVRVCPSPTIFLLVMVTSPLQQ